MQTISLVKFRKYTRMIVLRRRNIATIPEKATKYIHKSATFATMMSDIGIERIGSYLRSMTRFNEFLDETVKTGFIDIQMLTEEVESINKEAERTSTDLSLIDNSLIRFVRTDCEKSKISCKLKARIGKDPSPEIEQDTPGLSLAVPAEAPKFAQTDSHAHE